MVSQCRPSVRMSFNAGIGPDCDHSLCNEARMSVWWCWVRSYHDVNFITNSHWKPGEFVHFQVQWTYHTFSGRSGWALSAFVVHSLSVRSQFTARTVCRGWLCWSTPCPMPRSLIRLLMRWYHSICDRCPSRGHIQCSDPSNVMSMLKIRKRVGFGGLVGECVGSRSLGVEARCGQSLGKLLWTVTSGWS